MDVARNLKANRTSGGALQLEGVEVQIQLDDTKKIEDLVPKQVHKKDYALFKYCTEWILRMCHGLSSAVFTLNFDNVIWTCKLSDHQYMIYCHIFRSLHTDQETNI